MSSDRHKTKYPPRNVRKSIMHFKVDSWLDMKYITMGEMEGMSTLVLTSAFCCTWSQLARMFGC